MGDLVHLTRPATTAARSTVSGGSAAILFFTGVRYYRFDDVSAMPKPSVGSKRPRSSAPRKSRRDVLVEMHG